MLLNFAPTLYIFRRCDACLRAEIAPVSISRDCTDEFSPFAEATGGGLPDRRLRDGGDGVSRWLIGKAR